ncbi:MAG: DegT/DnrJ/EryC1/StrS family aminotransferase, partial [Myxococcota bacterium]
LGPNVDAFEQEMAAYVGVGHAAALSSGTAALHLGLMLLGVGPGDDVINSTLTFVATANAICYVGATPVFLDVSADTWTIDPDLLEEELHARAVGGRLPRAVIPVDLYGQCADYDRIRAVCDPYGIPVLQDAAEGLGATCGKKRAGGHGQAAVLSFNGNKIITTSGGGMLLSDDGDLIARARHLATQAREPAPHYQHEEIGYNYRMSNLLAAVGRGQLANLPQKVAARRRNRMRYLERIGSLPGISFMPEAPYGQATFWLTVALIDDAQFGASREDIRLKLAALGIESRPVWKPMHLQPVFRDAPVRLRGIADHLFQDGLCLPSGSSLRDEEHEEICGALAAARCR